MKLSAGQLSMTYQNGFLRWISTGEQEVLRMLYFAVRDKDWATIPGKIKKEHIEQKKNSFHITYEMQFKQHDINMHWQASIKGTADNTIAFEIKGKALSTFKKNRTGFCVLHPVKECTGKDVFITHSDGRIEENKFPEQISPYQPFKDIINLEWNITHDVKVSVAFEGEIFETEDHRNWTDNNFKTYCTPLGLPFPETVHKGDTVHQKITIKIDGAITKKEKEDYIKISIGEEIFPFPQIGIGRASKRNKDYTEALKGLSDIGFSHYRVDIKLSAEDWQQTLETCIKEAETINARLEIALFLYKGCNKNLRAFCKKIKNQHNIQQIILLEENKKCITNKLLNDVMAIVSPLLPYVKIGAGTDVYFTELNRSNLDSSSIDFVNYSVNPQVHAVDDASVMENAFAQADTVTSAFHQFNKPVHVSPITLKMRYNADAADLLTTALPLSDERQSARFTAAWTLASIKALAESGAGSATYFETIGVRGIGIHSLKDGLLLYPVGKLFKYLFAQRQTHLTKSYSSKPFEVCSIVLARTREIIIANLTDKEKIIILPKVSKYIIRDLINSELIETGIKSNQVKLSALQLITVLVLRPST